MTENDHTSHAEPQVEPALRGLLEQPKGVLQKNLKTFVYLGAALLVIVAALFSSTGKKTPAQQAAAKGQPPQPTLQDNTDNNVQDMKNQVQAERQKEQQAASAVAEQDPALASATPAQQAAAAAFGPSGEALTSCGSGRPCAQSQQGTMPPQLTPEQQQAQIIAAKERERADNSRFASNLVYSRVAEQQPQQPQGQTMPTQYDHTERQAKTNLVDPQTEKEQDETRGGYHPSNLLTIRIVYHGFPRTGLYFTNPNPSYPNWFQEIYSQGETEFNHYWFPCWDYPNDMATSETITTVPEGQSVVSNGRLMNLTRSQGFVTYDWVETVPHSSYLISIAVGPWHKFSDTSDGLPVEYYVAKNVDEATARRSFHLTPDVIGFFSHALEIPFPYEKYAQVAVENDMFGWQENVSATTVTDTALHDERADQDYPSIGGMSHEVGQHLFGDYVQARDWANIWLNEGFATYMEALYLQHHEGNDAYRYAMHEDRLAEHEEDRESYRRPLVDRHYTDTMDMVDATTHVKGAAVLDMLRYLIDGPDAAFHPASQNEMFFRALHSYLVSHHGQSVDAQDMLRCLRDTTGMELGWFFREWVYMAGYPEYEVQARYDNAAKVERVTISQKQQVDAEVPVFEMPIELAFYGKNGEKKRVLINDYLQQQEFEVSLEFEPEWVDFDPDDYIDKTVQFKKSEAELIAEAVKDPSMMSRLWAVQQLGLTSDGNPDARMNALSRVLETDEFNGVRAAAATSLGEMKLSRAKDYLLAALQQPSSEVRTAVVAALGKFTSDPKVYRRLRDILRDDPSYAVEGAAMGAVGRSGMPDAFDILKAEVLANPEIHVMRASLSALVATKDPRAVMILIAESQPGVDERVRVIALSELAGMKEQLQTSEKPELTKVVGAALRDSYLLTQQAGEELVGIYHLTQFEAEIKTRSLDPLMPLDRPEAAKVLEQLHRRD